MTFQTRILYFGFANMKHRLLIVEDDLFVQDLLATCLSNEGYKVVMASSGQAMFEALDKDNIDLILLDLTLPDEDGLTLARKVRTRSSTPIIVLTSREEQEDRIAALEIGADDYLTKPCDIKELSLRVRNLLGRSGGVGAIQKEMSFNGWTFDVSGGALTSPDGEDVLLPRTEFDLLAALLTASNRTLSRGFLLDSVSRGEDSGAERMIDVLISRLRKRLETDPKNPELIITVPGQGYKFRMPAAT